MKGNTVECPENGAKVNFITTDEIQRETQIKDNAWVLKGISSLSHGAFSASAISACPR